MPRSPYATTTGFVIMVPAISVAGFICLTHVYRCAAGQVQGLIDFAFVERRRSWHARTIFAHGI
jgi:hypothetical protein